MKQGQFKKGFVPSNKGKKLEDFMSPETIEKFKRNQFKKGNLPHNTKADGVITIRTDNRNVPYQWIRLALRKWQMLHVKIWIDHFGPVPKGKNVYFKNGNTMDVRIENLGLETDAENMRRNSIQNYPEELRATIRTLTKLKKIINGKEQHTRSTKSSV